jgi:proline iminopeptidase
MNDLTSLSQLIDFYPETGVNRSGFLKLDERHSMYWEECGNPRGVPVVFLHGGPGAGATSQHRRFFDPSFYRIIIFDQRGAGRSKPLGEVIDNTTPLLVEDIERLREMLNVERWLVFGGSWGSTLALAYAQSHPARCTGLILRGIFLCRKSEIDWFLYGLKTFFPEAWYDLVKPIPERERSDLLLAYYWRLCDPDPAIHMPVARTWSVYEGRCSTLLPNPRLVDHYGSDVTALGLARIEAHYFVHNIFLPENSLLSNVDKIRHIPSVIVQGRYDAVCPIISADDLHRAWPEAEYIVVPGAGHAAFEPGIRSQLIAATNRFRDKLKRS